MMGSGNMKLMARMTDAAVTFWKRRHLDFLNDTGRLDSSDEARDKVEDDANVNAAVATVFAVRERSVQGRRNEGTQLIPCQSTPMSSRL